VKPLLIVVLFLFSLASHAEEIEVKTVNLTCKKDENCSEMYDTFKHLARVYESIKHLKRTVQLYALNEGIYAFEYNVIKEQEGLSVNIELGVKKVLLDYDTNIIGDDYGIELPTILPVREMEFLDDKLLLKSKLLLQEVIQSQGFPDVKINYAFKEEDEGVSLEINILPGPPVVVNEIQISSDSEFLKAVGKRMLSRFKGENYHLQEVKNTLEELRQLYIEYGYYLAEISLDSEAMGGRKMKLNVAIKSNELHVFKVDGNQFFNTTKIKELLENTVLGFKRKLSTDSVSQSVKGLYAEAGFTKADVETQLESYKNINGEKVNFYKIKIDENIRTKIQSIEFNGNSVLSSKRLRALFFKEAPSVVKTGFFQQEYVNSFTSLLRKEYIIRGYVNVLVEDPRLNLVNGKVYITYRLREGVKAVVEKLTIKGVGEDLEQELISMLTNTEKKFFNPTTFKTDLEMIENRLRQKGFYYASIKNKNSGNIVRYKNENSNVLINIEIDLDKVFYVDQVIIVGNRKTRTKLIRRELELKSGDVVTREAIQQSQTNLLGLNIFASVLIEPIPNRANTADILVSVREKDFGIIEIAPGVRTDIGLKLSTNVTYNNLDGMNKRISFKGQVNKRFNLNSLDERRREESSSLIEYDLAVDYAENHIFNSDVDFSSSISSSRRRFFSFDADIRRINYTINKDFTPWFSASLRQQFENIEQFDASVEREEGTFRIGSITPSVTFDFRDNRINPISGSWFNLSMETANPALFSQDDEELTINYYKVISRNRFYVPMGLGTFAISLAAGMQENLAKEDGYIPNIKVFRLNGVDVVRGYEDDEINRLPSGMDISEVQVDNKAYMAVLKLEPRFFISDTSMFGVFYDTGRVFVDSYDTSELRSSVGFTFKYLTPVGSLDFDYGIKLLRKKDESGSLESPGRLHVSIGFF
tara:strand:+ start:127205 stop:129991 length:2787 start_codon:yes stop_codon:yes gene_type:complete